MLLRYPLTFMMLKSDHNICKKIKRLKGLKTLLKALGTLQTRPRNQTAEHKNDVRRKLQNFELRDLYVKVFVTFSF